MRHRAGRKEIAAERNQTKELPDASAHAEMMTSRRACEKTGELELRGATLYATLQPCGMCTMAPIWSKIGRVGYGAGRSDVHPIYFETKLVDTLGFIGAAYRDDIEIKGGCLRKACTELYYGSDAELSEEERQPVSMQLAVNDELTAAISFRSGELPSPKHV